MILKLITVPNPLLRQKSTPIKEMNTKNVQFISNLVNTLVKKKNPGGVGLSAIQVGVPLRVFATLLPPIYDMEKYSDDSPPPEIKVFINPEIVSASKEMTYGGDKKAPAFEGCLSIPSLYGPVPRHQSITLKYLTLSGTGTQEFVRAAGPHGVGASTHNSDSEPREEVQTFSNFYARVIQHEYDHLEGVLFTDYIKTDGSELYFDQGKNLVEIAKPEELIVW